MGRLLQCHQEAASGGEHKGAPTSQVKVQAHCNLYWCQDARKSIVLLTTRPIT